MSMVFVPGCTLSIYKPHLAKRLYEFFQRELGEMEYSPNCCRRAVELPQGAQVIDCCSSCDERLRERGRELHTVIAWEVLKDSETFPFPDYKGMPIAIHDACSARRVPRIHHAVRAVLKRMNLTVVEPAASREKSVCCGDNFVGHISDDKVREQMKRRASQMPCDDVVVYCVSCVKSMHMGGKKAYHLIDLLYGEQPNLSDAEPEQWHRAMDGYIKEH